ncbi:MAG: diguanylate cyclase/phosphodiesterase (GGDEF & EAL domains) with PAS/PAC sensor(s) [uncultured Solirubrobacteraceae bacterium]|uniref:Diguanylate cyclase/phosphodiesterase (GGDEF & EAL domains) with PAS/PAC sensor(S) n=1 Tax=uncultured Solirubrobacteraceae bacterium TaxID=1162706 RepID=A0A6J4RIS9_9ACTN|nr:MAG: diguanylate cyclase/phosphodiesterase (GGDEF & EAL domains) with PAS/PAC sensor(s) [uncultured Solirubrobacteraceae bacterium]
MSDPTQAESSLASDTLAILGAVRGLAAAALKPTDDESEDQDVSELLVDGLLDVGAVARVRKIRLHVAEQTVYEPEPLSAGQVEAVSASSMRETLSTVEPIARRGDEGEIVALMTPLVSRTGAIDLFVLEAGVGAEGLSPIHSAMVATLRDQAAAALAVRRAQTEARLDPLTGCLNHGAMKAQLDKEVARAQRRSGRLACVMLDLDDFKAVNESHGHPVGDQLLRTAAAAMLEECRSYDFCCRYGGDEFLVILPDTGIVDAVRTAERLRAAVARSVVEHGGATIAVQATAGVADWQIGESAASLLERVDQALIAGKGAGKDGVGLA